MLMLSFMGILMCVSLLFGEDSEGSGTSGISPGGNSVSEEVLKHRSMVEKYAKESDILDYVPILLAIIKLNLVAQWRTSCKVLSLRVYHQIH